jgi:hypothetical protein
MVNTGYMANDIIYTNMKKNILIRSSKQDYIDKQTQFCTKAGINFLSNALKAHEKSNE